MKRSELTLFNELVWPFKITIANPTGRFQKPVNKPAPSFPNDEETSKAPTAEDNRAYPEKSSPEMERNSTTLRPMRPERLKADKPTLPKLKKSGLKRSTRKSDTKPFALLWQPP